MPSFFSVSALKALQNSMIFTPFWPKAGPIGGAGEALPASHNNFKLPAIFFIKSSPPD